MTLNTGKLDAWCVLVTGASGFIGRRLVPMLIEAGASVIGIDPCAFSHPPASNSFFQIQGGFREKEEEIKALMDSMQRANIAIVHLAGMTHVGESERYPHKAFEVNVGLTASVLEFCRKYSVRRMIFASTCLVYGDKHENIVHERTLPAPMNLYAATKLAAEVLMKSYSQTYGFSTLSARIANVYGPGGNPDTVISLIVQKIRNGEEVIVRDKTSVRDFVYVDDVAKSFLRLLLIDDLQYSGIVNISTAIQTSIAKLIETACAVAGQTVTREQDAHSTTTPVSFLVLDNSLLQQLTGWTPGISLADGLSTMIKDNRTL